MLRVHELCEEFGRLMNKPVHITGEEAGDALLSNASKSYGLFGAPSTSAETMIRWTADWVARGGENLDKPTHFESRDGKY